MAAMRAWTGESEQRWASGIAVLAACGLLGAIGLAACGPNAASADTVLSQAPGAVLAGADGHSRPAHDGMVVPHGTTVLSGPSGAILTTLGRQTLIGGMSAVTVLDGAREALVRGQVLVNAQGAPGLSLEAGAATVDAARGSLVRVERAALLRVGQFRGSASVRAAGRRASTDLSALYQVQVPFGALPGVPTPLVLADDQWEQRFARDLVESDVALTALARGLDAPGPDGATVAGLVPVSFSDSSPLQAGAPRSELALGFALAAVGHVGGATAADRYRAVRGYRDAGGSWGVVAALVAARTDNVSGVLDRLLAAPASTVALAGGPGQVSPAELGRLLGGGSRQPGPPPPPNPQPSGGPSASPRPQPSPAATSQVDQVVNAINSLAPTPAPSVSPTIAVPVPGPAGGPSRSPLLEISLGPVHVQVGG